MGSLTAQSLGTSIIGFVFQFALIRLVPAAQYGVYSAVSVAIGIAGSCATFGLNQAVARYLAMLQQQDEQKSWVAARKILYLVLGLTIVVTAVYMIIAPNLSLYFTKGTTWTNVFLLGGVWLFLIPISSICTGIIQGLRRYTLLAKMLFVPRAVIIPFAVVTLIFYHNIEAAILAWVAYCFDNCRVDSGNNWQKHSTRQGTVRLFGHSEIHLASRNSRYHRSDSVIGRSRRGGRLSELCFTRRIQRGRHHFQHSGSTLCRAAHDRTAT